MLLTPWEIDVSSHCLHLALWPFSHVTLEFGNYMLVCLCVPVSPLPSYEPSPFSSSCGANFSYTYASNQNMCRMNECLKKAWMKRKEVPTRFDEVTGSESEGMERHNRLIYRSIPSRPRPKTGTVKNPKRSKANCFPPQCDACSFLPSAFSQHQ